MTTIQILYLASAVVALMCAAIIGIHHRFPTGFIGTLALAGYTGARVASLEQWHSTTNTGVLLVVCEAVFFAHMLYRGLR